MDLDAIAQELYTAPRGDFVGRRAERAAEAKAAGDKELSAEIKKLRKPSTAAWLLNQVAGDAAPLLDVGAQLRQAHEALDGRALRELSSRRREVVDDVLGRVRSVAAAQGMTPGAAVFEQVRATLDAAVNDADVGHAVASGRMAKAATESGFEAWLAVTPVVAPGTAARRPSTVDLSPGKRTDTAEPAPHTASEREVERARQDAAAAEQVAERAGEHVTELQAEVDAARATVADLRARLFKAEKRESSARARVDAARREHEQAIRAAHIAQRGLHKLERRG